jgi:hypothetical protein
MVPATKKERTRAKEINMSQETLFDADTVVVLDTRRCYFGLSVCETRIKIGISKRPSGHRGGEMHFDELCCVRGGKSVEDYYHQMYAAERIGKTEWFYLSDRLAFDLIVMCIEQGRMGSAERLKRIMLARLQKAPAAA